MANEIMFIVEHLRGEISDISYVLAAAARSLADMTSAPVVAVLLSSGEEPFPVDFNTDKLIHIKHPALGSFNLENYRQALLPIIQERSPAAVLLGDTSIGSGLAGELAWRAGLPLISSVHHIRSEAGAAHFVCKIYGGKILAEGAIPGSGAVLTMIPGGYSSDDGHTTKSVEVEDAAPPALEENRVSLLEYVEPEAGDVDISRESLLVAVGRGIQREDNLELAQELAQALGGTVCASRPVVDQGWLPTSRMVGKSGKHVKPKLYLAFGISGAPEHMEGASSSDLIIAVNTDPAAPIFEFASYGAEVDALDLMPILTEKIQAAKGG
jgi:electron transfer flavoprotein alpha subunit